MNFMKNACAEAIELALSIARSLQARQHTTDDDLTISPTQHPSDVHWNSNKGAWENSNGPAVYRVTWLDAEENGKKHSRDFRDIDNGYDFFQDVRKTPGLYGATWEHVYQE